MDFPSFDSDIREGNVWKTTSSFFLLISYRAGGCKVHKKCEGERRGREQLALQFLLVLILWWCEA